MTRKLARYSAAMIAFAGLGLAGPAFAQDKTVKIGVLNDMSSLYGRHRRSEFGRRHQDGGRGFRNLTKKGVDDRCVSGDHQNKPDVGVNIARQWIDAGKSRCDRRYAEFRRRARGEQTSSRRRTRCCSTPAPPPPISPARPCSPEHDFLHLRHLHAGQRHRQGTDQGRRRQLVLPDRGLRIRHALSAITAAVVTANGGKVLGAVRHPLNTADFSSFLPAGRMAFQGQRLSPCPMPAATPPTRSSRRPNSASSRAAKKLAGVAVSSLRDVHSLGLKNRRRASTFTESFYWDLNEKTREWSKRLRREGIAEGHDAIDDGSRQLRGRTALLKALEALGGNPHDGAKVVAKMKEITDRRSAVRQGPVAHSTAAASIPAYLFEVTRSRKSRSIRGTITS